jgi:hypothetical protein
MNEKVIFRHSESALLYNEDYEKSHVGMRRFLKVRTGSISIDGRLKKNYVSHGKTM